MIAEISDGYNRILSELYEDPADVKRIADIALKQICEHGDIYDFEIKATPDGTVTVRFPASWLN